MPGNFITPQDERQYPADAGAGALVGVFEAEEIYIQQRQREQRAKMGCSKKLKGRTRVVAGKEIFHLASLG